MRILLINHYAGSEAYGMEYRPFYFAREWNRLGHDVAVVAASFSHLRIRTPGLNGRITRETVEGIPYLWLKTPSYKNNGTGRLMNMISFGAGLFFGSAKILREFKPDAVIASSPHPFIIYAAEKIAREAGAKLVFEVRDLWPLSLVELGRIGPSHPLTLILQKTEDYAYRISDKVVSLLPKAQNYMCSRGLAPDKFAYIPNGISLPEWGAVTDGLPPQFSESITAFKKEGRFIIGYTGYYGVANALYPLLEAASMLKNERVALVLVGKGPEEDGLRKRVEQLQLRNVTFLPSSPKAYVTKILECMDALYIGWMKNPIYRFGISPNKLMDYMMSARPIIHSVEAGNDPVAESFCGISVPPESSGAIAGGVKTLMGMTERERTLMGFRGRDYVVKHHDYQVLAGKFIDVLNS